MPGRSFLDNLGRIAVPDFAPTDGTHPFSFLHALSHCVIEDILRARLKTLGVTEHRFTIKSSESYTLSNAN